MTLTGVMLGIVLLALSAGYWRGGVLSSRWESSRLSVSLSRNLAIAAVWYGLFSFPFEARLLDAALGLGLSLPLAIGVMAAILFLLPVYLASQTVPMLAELSSDGRAGAASGRVLFFSTLGSVAGGILTPVWLFPWLGVTVSGRVVCVGLGLAAALMVRGVLRPRAIAPGALAGVALALIAGRLTAGPPALYEFDSAYQSMRIEEKQIAGGRTERVFYMGGGRASGIYTDTGETSFAYTRVVMQAIEETKPTDLLVIGAAGFTLPRDAAARPYVSRIDAVDVDPIVRPIAEQHFLRHPLPAKVRFLPLSGRFAVHRFAAENRRYGLTVVDAFFGQGIPEELVTAEFFRGLRAISGRVIMNVVMDRDADSIFASNLLTTFRSVFGRVWLTESHPGDDSFFENMEVSDWPLAGSTEWTGSGTPYLDDRNSADRDHVELVWTP